MKNTENEQLDDLIGGLDENQRRRLELALRSSRKKPSTSRFFARKFLGTAAALVILAGGSVAVWAAVDDDWGTSDLLTGGVIVPYDGFLMLGSDAANGTRDVTFELWDDEASTDPGNLIWSETQTVDFFNGRFSVGLGNGSQTSTKTIDEAILDGEQLYLAVQVKDDSDAWVPLAGRQAIEAVPYSAWSANAADFAVKGDLDVTGTLNAGRITNVRNSDYNLWIQGSNEWSGGNARNLALLGIENGDILRINHNAEYAGGVEIQSDLTVSGDLTVGTTAFSGFTVSAAYADESWKTAGNGWGDYSCDAADDDCSDPTPTTMTPTANSICYLTTAYNSHTDDDPSVSLGTGCYIDTEGDNWRLRARAVASTIFPATYALCEARCLSW